MIRLAQRRSRLSKGGMLTRESDEIVGCGPMSRRYIASTVPASLVLISGWLGGVNCFCSRVSADIGRAGSLRGRPRLRPLVRRRSKGCDEEPGNKGQQPPHGPLRGGPCATAWATQLGKAGVTDDEVDLTEGFGGAAERLHSVIL